MPRDREDARRNTERFVLTIRPHAPGLELGSASVVSVSSYARVSPPHLHVWKPKAR